MRREDDVKPIFCERAFERLEYDLLQQRLPARIAENSFRNAIAAIPCRVDQAKSRNAFLDHGYFMFGVSLLFGKIAVRAGHDQTEVAGTGGIEAGIIDFVQNAVTEGEPDPAACGKRSPH